MCLLCPAACDTPLSPLCFATRRPFTADLVPWLGYCNMTTGMSHFAKMTSQVRELVVSPPASGTPPRLMGVVGNDLVLINPNTGAFTKFATFPNKPYEPSLVRARARQLTRL